MRESKVAPAGNNTGKTIKGEIRNIDTYSKVEIIAIPYIDNVPGTPIVFSVNAIPQIGDEEVTILSIQVQKKLLKNFL